MTPAQRLTLYWVRQAMGHRATARAEFRHAERNYRAGYVQQARRDFAAGVRNVEQALLCDEQVALWSERRAA